MFVTMFKSKFEFKNKHA